MRVLGALLAVCAAAVFWSDAVGAQYVSGMGLYAMNLTGQPPSRTTLPGMLGSIAIDGSPTHCANVNIGSVVQPNVFDGLGESFTVEAWIMHPNPADGQYKPFLARHPGMNLGNEASEFTFQIQPEGNVNFFAGCGNFWQYGFNIGLKDAQFPSWRNYTVQPNTWTHVAAVVEWGAATYGVEVGFVSLFVNGNLIDRKPWGTDDEIGACTGRRRSRAPGQPVRIGYYDNSDDGVQTFGGVIDEVRIWNGARTQRQIQDHMHGLLFDKTGLLAYMGFNEGLEGIFPTQTPIIRIRHSFSQGLAMFPCASAMFDAATQMFDFLPWQRSGLKIHNAPITTVSGMGATSGELLGVDLTTANYSETFNFWVTGMLFTTDATAWYYKNNVTRTQIAPPFPIQVPNGLRIEYSPGKRAGIDVVLYEAFSPAGAPEPPVRPPLNATTDCCNGSTKMTFRVLCPLARPPDRCGVCGGTNMTLCPCHCDAAGAVQSACGTCGPGPDCRGCDCILFSGAKPDCCGICNGRNVNSTTMADCPNDLCAPGPGCPRFDACDVCGGDNSTCQCVAFQGYPTARLDYALLNQSLASIVQQARDTRDAIALSDSRLPATATLTSNLALAADIAALHSYCATAGAMIVQLDQLLAVLSNSTQVWGPCGPLPPLPCTMEALYAF